MPIIAGGTETNIIESFWAACQCMSTNKIQVKTRARESKKIYDSDFYEFQGCDADSI